jgi:hypothetical protein
MTTFKEFLNESSLGRVYQHTQSRNMGMITAFRGRREGLPAGSTDLLAVNRAKNRALLKDIYQSNYPGFIKVQGHYIEQYGTDSPIPVKEESFLVLGTDGDDHGKLKKLLIQWGIKYDQETVLYKAWDSPNAVLIGTSASSSWLPLGQEQSIGTWHPSRVGEIYSTLKNGRKPSFAFGESVESPDPDLVGLHWSFIVPRSFFMRGHNVAF